MAEEGTPNWRPFHETIVEAIKRCSGGLKRDEIFCLLELIRLTKIPAGHNEILEAIDQFFGFPYAGKDVCEVWETRASLHAQKAEAEEAAKAKQEVQERVKEKLARVSCARGVTKQIDELIGLIERHRAEQDELLRKLALVDPKVEHAT